jgi:CDP-6-deoxy-D-xylo-4-hexulose-3-dehydrase
MTDYIYPTAFNTFGQEERDAADRVLETGYLTIGPEVKRFEREFADTHGKQHGIMCNSGSSANLLMVAALFHRKFRPLKRGDKVAVPALAWSTTYAPLIQYGLEPVLLDVNESWNALPDQLADMSGVRLFIGVSILGIPAALAVWRRIAHVRNAHFIEDNCESVGAKDARGRLCGTFGEMASFSFFWSHQINGIEGGMVLTNDDELADLCRMLRAHGWTRDVHPRERFEDEYDFRVHGYNLRPLEIHAAVARVQLDKLQQGIDWRYRNAVRFYLGYEKLDLGILHPLGATKGDPSFFGIHFILPPGTRPRAVEALRARGIDCRLPAGGSFGKHVYGAPWASQPTPNADHIHENGLFIGNAPFDISAKVDMALDVLQQVFHGWNGREAEGSTGGGGLPKGNNSATCDPA